MIYNGWEDGNKPIEYGRAETFRKIKEESIEEKMKRYDRIIEATKRIEEAREKGVRGKDLKEVIESEVIKLGEEK